MNEYDNLIANQPVAGNEYDAILDDVSKQNRAAFVGAGLQARTATPDQHAEALTLGRETGVPPAVALTNRDDLMAQRETQRVDRIMQQSPILARWASVPENHGVAQDDFDAMALLERTFTSMMYPMVGLAAQAGAVATGATDTVSKPLGGAARRIPGLAGSLVGGIHDIAEPAGDWLEITTGLSGIPEQELRDEDQLAALTRLSGWLRSFEGQGYDPMVKWDDVKSNPLLAPGFIVEQGVVSSPDMAAAMLALPAYITARTEDIASKRAENEGRPGEVTLGDMGKAAPSAIIESVLERLTTKYLLRGSKAATPAGRVATQTGMQAATGGAEELTAYLGETVGTERGARGNEALDTFMAGALVEGGIGAGFEFAQVVTERAQTIEQSVADQARLQALTQAAAGLKTSERAPELVEQYVRQLREAGQDVPDSVYLSLDAARTFLQAQGMDANAELTNLAGSPEAMVEATATGDLKVPLERWLAYGAKRPDIAELQKHARLDPERLSPAELEALNLDDLIAEVMQDQERGNEAAARAADSAVGPDPTDQVRDDITGQLLAAGVDRSTAEAQAQVLAQRYATRAERRGKGETAAEVFALSGIEIVRETPAMQKLRQRMPEIDTVIDPLLDAVRTGRVPTQSEIYGPSLVSALIRAGGLQDSGGELRSRDARLARPGLVNRNGMTFDDALQFARENGYLPPAGDGVDTVDIGAVIDLIDRELRGDPVYAAENTNARALGFSEAVDQIDAELRAKGIDTNKATNEEMKAALGIAATEERGFDQVPGSVGNPLPEGDLQRALAMSEDDYIAAVNPSGARTSDEDVILFAAGDIAAPADAVADPALAFTDKRGRPVTVLRASDGGLYAQVDGQVVGSIESRNGETMNTVAEEYQGAGIGTGLARALIMTDPFAQAGSFSDAGERARRAAFRQLKSEQGAHGVAITDTPEFKRWFKDSKVVDADGKPLVVYHGTRHDFDSFRREGRRGQDRMHYFAADPGVASEYGGQIQYGSPNVMPVYLSLQKAYEFDADGAQWGSLPITLFPDEIRNLFDDRNVLRGREGSTPQIGFTDVNRAAQIAGYDGVIARNIIDGAGTYGDKTPTTVYVAFRPEQIKSVNNRGTFDPNDPRILFQRTRPLVTRGRIEFRPEGGARIVLTENANLSTFLHETGHLWLEELITDSQVNPELAADMDRVLAWMGLDVRSADGADAIRLAVQSDQHEQWARGFEAYLREGRAPAPALREIFARFRAWLVRLYRDIRSLNVEVSDEVRGVFDRLIATDEEIARAQAANLQAALATSPEEAAALGMSTKEFADYAEARDRATQEAREEVEQELIAAWERQSRGEYQRERERMRIEVEADVNRQPVFRAILALQADRDAGGIRLDRRELVDRYGEAYLKRLPGPGRDRNRGRYVYAVEGGMSLDEAGLLLGYDSGDAMVQALVNAQDRQAVIDGETDVRMREFYPDPMTDGTIAERARKAVHSGARAEVLDRELRVLAKAAGAKPYQARVIASIAERMIGRKAIRALRPNEYLVAERKAGREAMQALAAKQFDIAYRARFRQALNARLFRLATDAQDRVEADRKYLRRFDKRALREKIGKAGNGWLEAIDSLLADYNLQTLSGAEIDRRAASRQILEAAEQGLIDLPDAVRQNLESARQTNWRELTVDDMRGLVDAVRQLETVAIREWRMIVDGEIRLIEDDAAAIADSVRAGGRYVEPNLGSKSKAELLAKWGKEALGIWLRPAAIARQADGGEERGALTRLIVEPMRRAVSEKLEPMKAKARDDLAALYGKFYSRRELIAMSSRRTRMAEIGQDWTKFDLLALALNWGNEQNRQAVLEGRANGRQVFTEDGVRRALQRLTENDWKFVQAVWDYVNTYWPEIEATQKRRTGLAPAKVEAKPFEFITGSGETVSLRGGYYPLKYDSDTDANTRADDLEDAFQRIRTGRHGKAATSRGHTIERVGSGKRPVRMDINVLHQHLSSVIHDLALGDVVDYVYKVLNNGATKAAFSETAKLEDWKALNIWLKDAAAGEMAARTFADKAFRWIRVGFTKSKLGFNIITALLQPTGLAQTAVVTGKLAFLRGATAFASNPVAAWKQVQDASAFMRARYSLNAWNKDVQDTLDALRGKHGIIPSWVGPAMFIAIGKTQQVVDTVTWLAGYHNAMNAGETHAEAVKVADGIVENSQTSGFFSDRSALERGTLSDTTRQSEFVRAWTALASYMIAKGNIAYERARTTNYRSPAQVANLIGDMMLLFTVEAVMAAAIRGTLPDDDDDWWWWLAGSSAESVAATVPFVREVPSAVKGFAVGGGPVGTLLNDIGKAWTQAQQGEVDASLIKSANNVGGTLFHYPSAQMNRAIDAYWRENVEGEEVAPIEYLTGRRDPR